MAYAIRMEVFLLGNQISDWLRERSRAKDNKRRRMALFIAGSFAGAWGYAAAVALPWMVFWGFVFIASIFGFIMQGVLILVAARAQHSFAILALSPEAGGELEFRYGDYIAFPEFRILCPVFFDNGLRRLVTMSVEFEGDIHGTVSVNYVGVAIVPEFPWVNGSNLQPGVVNGRLEEIISSTVRELLKGRQMDAFISNYATLSESLFQLVRKGLADANIGVLLADIQFISTVSSRVGQTQTSGLSMSA